MPQLNLCLRALRGLSLIALFGTGIAGSCSAFAQAAADAADVPVAAGEAAFDRGVDLTREGRFEAALDAFEAARAAGLHGARLHFNLGVVHYRLGQLDAARAAFERAAADAETRDLAQYNLGLVALAADDTEQARRWFGRVSQQTGQPELRRLAWAALDKLDGSRARGQGSVQFARGHDSNVLVPFGAIADLPTSTDDAYWDLRGGWNVDLGWAEGLAYSLAGFAVEYDEMGAGDLALAEGAVEWRGPVQLSASAALSWVADHRYQNLYELRAQAAPWSRGAWSVQLETGATAIRSERSTSAALEGEQFLFGGALERRDTRFALSLGYRRIDNDRALRALSPTQDLFALRLRYAFSRLLLRGSLRWIESDYPGARRDQVSEAAIGATWVLSRSWDAVAEAVRQENESSEPGYSYLAKRFQFGVRLRF